MAKTAARRARVRAYLRKTRTTARGPSPRRLNLTDALAAHVRHLYEHTDTPLSAIAAEAGCHQSTIARTAAREQWKRYVPPPRDLSNAAKLLAQAEALEEGTPAGEAAAAEDAPPTANPSPPSAAPMGGGERARAEDIDRMEKAVRRELEIIESMRARLQNQPQSPLDALRTARALSDLTATLFKLQRLRCGLPEKAVPYEDDMPADIDAFRERLAQKIELFLVGWRARGPVEGQDDHDPGMAAPGA